MAIVELVSYLALTISGIVGFLLKIYGSQLFKQAKELSVLKTELNSLKDSADNKVKHLTDMTELRFQQMAENINKLSTSVDHVNVSINNLAKGLSDLLNKAFKDN